MPDDDSYAGEPPPSDPIGLPPPPAAPRQPPQAYSPVTPRYNGLAIAGMILGILWIYWVGSVLALIFGYISKGQIDESNGWQTGRGMAIAAIVLGWVGIGLLAVTIVAAIIVASNDDVSLGRLLVGT
ncbi:MAG: DUF4190 domain-containing protein [Acidimicrobiia bacterium]